MNNFWFPSVFLGFKSADVLWERVFCWPPHGDGVRKIEEADDIQNS